MGGVYKNELNELDDEEMGDFDSNDYGDIDDDEFDDFDGENAGDIQREEKEAVQKEMRTIDDKYLEKLLKNIREKPGYGTVSKCCKIMSDCIAERVISATENTNSNTVYVIADPDVLNKLQVFCLEEQPEALAKLLKVDDFVSTDVSIKTQKNELLAKSYLKSISNFLKELKNDKMLVYVLKVIRTKLIKLFYAVQPVYRKLVETTISLFGGDSESMNVKLEVLLLLLNFVKNADGPLREKIIKKCYMEFSKSSKTVNWRNWEIVNFTKNGIIELMTIDTEISYVIIFSIIQKWAKTLKGLQKKVKKDTVSALYNWGTINSQRVCVGCCIKVAAGNSENKADFEMVAYPLLEILIGILNLYPSSSYIPCRLKMVEQILNLCENLDINCSITRIQLDLQKSKEFMNKKLTAGKGEAKVDFDIYQKIPKSSQVFGDIWVDLFKRLSENIQRYFALSAEKVYATETSIFWIKMLRMLRKSSKDMEIKSQLKTQSNLLEQNYYNVDKMRVQRSAVPNDYLEKRNFILEEFQRDGQAPTKKLKTGKKNCQIIQELNKIRKQKEDIIKMKIDAEKELEITKIKKHKPRKTSEDDSVESEYDDEGELLNFNDGQDLDEDDLDVEGQEEEDLGDSEEEEEDY